MATITSIPTAGSLTVNGNTQVSGTISWSKPTVPSDATITSCVLTGTATASISKGGATITVNGTTVESGSQFTINLGTANNTTSVTTTAKGGNKNANGTVSFSNLVYTVTYELPKATYTVIFVDWDGAVLKTQQVEEGASATAPTDPTRDGYRFTGWDNSFNNITSDLTVTAQYVQIVYYTVTFVDWDGMTLKIQQVEEGASATAPANPSRNGYQFTGWDKAVNNIISDLTVTATYKKIHTIQFVDWDGTVLKTQTILDGEEGVTAPANPTRDRYKFEKWSGSDGSTYTNSAMIFRSDITFTATYLEIVYYIVRFLDWDGTVLKEEEVENGNAATAPANPTREGYEFTGWDIDFSNVTSNLNVTAQYSIKSYTVTFKDWDGTTLKTETVKHGSNATAPTNPTREGYTFTGWLPAKFNYIIEDLTVTAQYTINGGEPEEDVIEWTGTGTVATGLNSGIKHSNYKINLDWDNEYFDIILQNYTQTGNGVADTKVCSVRINNNTYDYYFSEDRIVLRQGSIDICECSSYVLPSTLRFAKDGVYYLYEEENVKIGEIEYGDDNVIYILEDDEYNTDFSMNFNLAVSERSSEDIEPEIKQLSLGNLKIDKLYIGEVGVKKVYLGEVLVYENKQTANSVDTLYNEFASTLFVLKENALSYDENELNLIVNSDVIEVNYDNENLNIGGDSE